MPVSLSSEERAGFDMIEKFSSAAQKYSHLDFHFVTCFDRSDKALRGIRDEIFK